MKKMKNKIKNPKDKYYNLLVSQVKRKSPELNKKWKLFTSNYNVLKGEINE